ncbi:MAG: alpha/beta fold hydrolase [Myxococcota bacterium]
MRVERLAHGRVELALHTLVESTFGPRPLLWLHALGGSTPSDARSEVATWPGSIFGLDFTGHGVSSLPKGGGYTAEVLMSDVDAALARLGPATVIGEGVGAYVALLIAGARPERVRGAVLCDGPGLAGGGPWPGPARIPLPGPGEVGPPDPFAVVELCADVRPSDYAASYLSLALAGSGLPRPLSLCARERPPWLQALVGAPGARVTTVVEALRYYAGVE